MSPSSPRSDRTERGSGGSGPDARRSLVRSVSRDVRGQTEPIAALVAVATIAIAIGLYAGYVGGVLPGTSDRAVEGPASEQIWKDIRVNGAYPGYDADAGPSSCPDQCYTLDRLIEDSSLPQGYNVYVEVTAFYDGQERVYGEEYFDTGGGTLPAEDHSELPPEDARAATRPIPVAVEKGSVKGGTLRVEVWS